MKLEIDLSEIFEDEDGNTISSSLTERIEKEIDYIMELRKRAVCMKR